MIEVRINKHTDGFRVRSAMLSKSGQALYYTGRVEHGRIVVELWSDNLADQYRKPFGFYRPYALVGTIRHGWSGVLRLNPAFAAMQCCSDYLSALLRFTGADYSYSKILYRYQKNHINDLGVKTKIEKMVGISKSGRIFDVDCSREFVVVPEEADVVIIRERVNGKRQFKIAARGYEAFKTVDAFVNEIKNVIKGE